MCYQRSSEERTGVFGVPTARNWTKVWTKLGSANLIVEELFPMSSPVESSMWPPRKSRSQRSAEPLPCHGIVLNANYRRHSTYESAQSAKPARSAVFATNSITAGHGLISVGSACFFCKLPKPPKGLPWRFFGRVGY
jgi:hypothetical protein